MGLHARARGRRAQGLRGDVEASHDAGVHGDEVDLGHVRVQAGDRLVDQAALVGSDQVQGAAIGLLGLGSCARAPARPSAGRW